MMVTPSVFCQVVEPCESVITSTFTPGPGTAVEDCTVDGLVVAVEVCAAAEG